MAHRFFSIAHMLLIALTAGLLFAGTAASAQSIATVYIPFAFTANRQTMPADNTGSNCCLTGFFASPTVKLESTRASSWSSLNPHSTSNRAVVFASS